MPTHLLSVQHRDIIYDRQLASQSSRASASVFKFASALYDGIMHISTQGSVRVPALLVRGGILIVSNQKLARTSSGTALYVPQISSHLEIHLLCCWTVHDNGYIAPNAPDPPDQGVMTKCVGTCCIRIWLCIVLLPGYVEGCASCLTVCKVV